MSDMRCSARAVRDAPLADLTVALDHVAAARTTTHLVEAAAEAVVVLGFDRSIVSGIHDAYWIVQGTRVRDDPRWAAEIVRVGREHPRRLDHGLVEGDVVRGRRPRIVSVGTEDRLHPEMAEVTMTRSYVTAPVTVRGRVVGLLHADCYLQGRDVDASDRDLLAAFASGYGLALERTGLQARIDTLRDDVGRLCVGLADVDEPGAPAPEQRSGATPWPLTAREDEVLAGMALGDTNARIARRLGLAETTVKSHVRNILRKLDATNRAQAVSRRSARTSTS